MNLLSRPVPAFSREYGLFYAAALLSAVNSDYFVIKKNRLPTRRRDCRDGKARFEGKSSEKEKLKGGRGGEEE